MDATITKELNTKESAKKLLQGCPLGRAVGECKWEVIRNLPVKERLEFFDGLSEDEIQFLYKDHIKCNTYRLKTEQNDLI